MPVAYLTRRYRFSSSHRLHAPSLDSVQNRETYGKCNNPHGHGHNYVVDVTVAGPIQESTGFVVDLGRLDAVSRREVIDRFDHRNLNMDAAFAADWVPTSENLTIEIDRVLRSAIPLLDSTGQLRLHAVRVEETGNNSFDLPMQAAPGLPVLA